MTEQEYISLFVKECNNDINAIEKKALGSWINADIENKKIYTNFKNDWEKAGTYKSELSIDKSKAWEKIQENISVKKQAKVVSVSNNKKWLRIAALLLVGLTTTFFVKTFILDNGFVNEKTAQNETKTITLPDGSTVVLNENSTLKYSKAFSKRAVSLKGEAFFDVIENIESPFSVKVNNTITHVLGTSFNIDANQKNKVELALLSGKVKFSNTKNNSIILTPGETAIYDSKTAIFSLTKNNTENCISWKTNKLVFENTKLTEVVKNLNDYFDTKITLKETQVNTACTFTGTFDNAKIAEVLEVISFSLNAEVAFSNNVYTIGSLDCN